MTKIYIQFNQTERAVRKHTESGNIREIFTRPNREKLREFYPAPEEDKATELFPDWLISLAQEKKKYVEDEYAGFVLAHIFGGSYDLLVTGIDETNGIAFGFASFFGLDALEAEYGTVSFKELQETRIPPLGLPLERETWSFPPGFTVEEWTAKKF